MSWSDDRANFERNLCVVIGINDYQNGIHTLSTPVNDATVLADLLENNYNYQQVIRLFPPHVKATLENINELLFETLPKKIKPTEGDRLLFYFAGHGVARNSEDGPAGYLIPQDAQLGKLETFFPMRDLNSALSQLDCHHLLVILDCCFAGNFRWSSARNVIPVPETIHREHYDRFIRFPAWQAITSAAHNQEALDFLSDLRDTVKNSHHSPFALALIEGLKDNKADLTGDGVITAPELYLYLRARLIGKDGISELQTPGLWPLPKHDRGEFIFTQSGFEREQLTPAPPLNKDNNPYRGLQPFDEKHARFFFGRQELVEKLYKRISQSEQSSSQLIVVVGISGSGKSSLVKAGLIPYLRKNYAQEWHILEPMRPGKSPFIALAKTIFPITNNFSDANKYKQLIRDLNKGESNRLIDILTEWVVSIVSAWSQANPQVKLLLTIDQFEELITMSRKATPISSDTKPDSNKQNPQRWLSKIFRRQSKTKNNERPEQKDDVQQEWQQFMALLTNTLKNCPQLHIVLTLRSDFEPRFVESAFKDYWDKARFPMRNMRADELREAIEKPASEMALYFESANSVDRLIGEVGEMPGALPLLSFTLSEFYIKLHQAWKEGKEDRGLTVDDNFYQQGGIAGSLTYRANEIYDALSDDAHRATMCRVMLRMVETQGGQSVRRQVPELELVYTDREENQRREKVIQSLVNARLVVKGQETGESYVEPAHDYLVRGWTKLQEWQELAQKNLSIEVQRRLTQAANDWSSTNQKQEQQGLLWNNDPRLPLFEQMLPTNVQRQYKSDEKFRYFFQEFGRWIYRQVLQQQKEIQKIAGELNLLNQREQEFVFKSVNFKHERLGQIFGSIIFVFLLVSGLGGLAWILRGQAVFNEKIAVARQLAAQSEQAGSQHFVQLSPLLAVESMQQFLQVDPALKVEADQALRNALSSLPLSTAHHNAQITRLSQDSDVSNVAFDRDGKYLTIASKENFGVWKVGSNQKITFLPYNAKINSIDLSPDGRYIATVSEDEKVWLWDVNRGQKIVLLPHKSQVTTVKFSPNGKYLASFGKDKVVQVWEANSGKKLARFQVEFESISPSLSMSLDGRYVAVGSWNDQTAEVWEVNSRKRIFRLPRKYNNWLSTIALSPDGQYLVTVYASGKTAYLWKTKSDEQTPQSLYDNDSDPAFGVTSIIQFSPDGKYFVTAASARISRMWETKSGREVARYPHDFRHVVAVGFSSDGKYVATASTDGTVKIWDARRGQAIARIPHDSTVNYGSIAFSPDNKYVVTASDDKTIQLSYVSPEDLIADACRRLNRNLSWYEWRQYFGNDLNQYRRTCPSLSIHPSFITEVVKSRKIEEAVAILRRLLEQNIPSNIDQTVEARRLVAPDLLNNGKALVKEGKIKEAINASTKAEQFDPTLKISVNFWRDLCWYGSLHGYAAKVMDACDKAVTLNTSPYLVGRLRDTRGVAKVLTGDKRGAIIDFQAAYEAEYSLFGVAKEAGNYKPSQPQRQEWINTLRAGQNPFTKEEIKRDKCKFTTC